jgi:hypothetical protein
MRREPEYACASDRTPGARLTPLCSASAYDVSLRHDIEGKIRVEGKSDIETRTP